MEEPIEQAPGWVLALATPSHELAALRAEALARSPSGGRASRQG
jgi:hypothetical protein